MKKFSVFAILFLLVGLGLYQCDPHPTETQDKSISQTELKKGFNLLETSCFACHSPEGAHEARVAPPMVAIKKHYITETTTVEEFTKDLIRFIQNPSKENSKMPGAIRQFGVMPKMEFSEAELATIARYIFYTELEEPGWFAEHYQSEKRKFQESGNGERTDYLNMGKSIALQTKAELGKNLMGAIQENGADGAVAFCNERAIDLTDSMGNVLQASIRRVSDQPRNWENKASEFEMAYIRKAKSDLAKGVSLMPLGIDQGDRFVGYYPISTSEMCLQCHGNLERDIDEATLAVMNKLYPEDQATGYGVNELRGIWVIELDKKSTKTYRHGKGKGKRSS